MQLSCPDDVLVASVLSSAAWILQWAYAGAVDPKPDVEAIVSGIRELVEHAEEIASREAAEDAAAKEAVEPVGIADQEGDCADTASTENEEA